MKILIICTSRDLGGLELYAEREGRLLQQQGHTCYFTIQETGRLAIRLQSFKDQSLFTQSHWNRLPLVTAIKLARYIDTNNIDLIHIHWSKDIALAALAKRLSKRRPKLVYSRHMGITRPKKDPYHRFLYNKIDRVLVVSKQVEQEAHDFLPLTPDRITLLYLGVPASDHEKPQKYSTLLPERFIKQPFRIGMFGRIEHGKGQHLLIEALIKLYNHGFNGGAMITGHVMDERYYQQLKRSVNNAGISDKVSFEGFIGHPLLAMSCCDVVVLLTYCETFGLVLAEAMRQEVAVIGTNAGGVPEIITDYKTGLLIPPGDSSALASSLLRLYEDEFLRKQLAQNGKIKADKVFNEETHFHTLNKVLIETHQAPCTSHCFQLEEK